WAAPIHFGDKRGGFELANEENLNTALLSIYPKFADSILSGEKKVEFRKTKMNKGVNRVVIYSTAPVKKVVGYFEVKEVLAKRPAELWKEFEGATGIPYEEFSSYYHGKKEAIGIVVGKTVKLKRPLPLNALGESLTPPQSFRYINWE